MKIRYVIKDLGWNKYYQQEYDMFISNISVSMKGGIVFATEYMSEEDANMAIVCHLPRGSYQVIKLYIKE